MAPFPRMAFDMAQTYVALERTGSATLLASTDRPPPNVDCLLVGAACGRHHRRHPSTREVRASGRLSWIGLVSEMSTDSSRPVGWALRFA